MYGDRGYRGCEGDIVCDSKESSDVDILVEFSKPIGLKFITLADYLDKILGKRVDLLTPNALKQVPEVWKKVKEDLIYVTRGPILAKKVSICKKSYKGQLCG